MYRKTNRLTAVNWATLIYLQKKNKKKKNFGIVKLMLLLIFQLKLLQSTDHIWIDVYTE